MTEPPPSADLSYLKRVAHAGRGRAAPFLPIMAVFGAAYGVCFLLIYASIVIDGAEDRGGIFYPWVHYIPPVAHLAFIVMAVWTAWRTLVSRGRGLSRAATAAWSAAFVAFVTVLVAFFYVGTLPASDVVQTIYMLPTMVLTLWGAAWWNTALMTDRRWLLIVAIASFAAALAATVIGNNVELVLLVGACLIGLAFFPAVLLMRDRTG